MIANVLHLADDEREAGDEGSNKALVSALELGVDALDHLESLLTQIEEADAAVGLIFRPFCFGRVKMYKICWLGNRH